MKTIDIIAKEWFDKVNGNSYFSARIITDWSMPEEKTYYLPYQYGYGDQYLQETKDFLIKNGLINPGKDANYFCFTRWCRENGIILRYTKIEKCLKRDVKNFVSNN